MSRRTAICGKIGAVSEQRQLRTIKEWLSERPMPLAGADGVPERGNSPPADAVDCDLAGAGSAWHPARTDFMMASVAAGGAVWPAGTPGRNAQTGRWSRL